MSGMVSAGAPVWTRGVAERTYNILVHSAIEQPRVSVIVPVYNMGANGYLAQLVDSLKRQSMAEIEFILVDDCSTDASLVLMQELMASDERFTVVASEKNGRQGAARNIGIDCARGEYIGFVDADDAVDPAFFETLYKQARQTGADIVVAPFVTTDEAMGNPSKLTWPFDHAHTGAIDAALRAYLIAHPAHVWCSLYRAGLFLEAGVRFPEGVYFEDNPTCLRLLCDARRIALLENVPDVPRYYYRQHGDSTDHRVDNLGRQIADRITTSNFMIEDAKQNGYYKTNKDAIDCYYIKVCLLNSLSKIAASNITDRSMVRKLAHSVRDNVRRIVCPLRDNEVYSQLALLVRSRMRLAMALPCAYVILARLALRAR